MLGLRGRYRTTINCRRRRLGPAGILGFRATVTPLSGSIILSRWSHRFSIAVESMIVERRHLLLPTDSSCEQRRKHSNDALPPRMCQFFVWGAGMTILTFLGNLNPAEGGDRVELVPGRTRVFGCPCGHFASVIYTSNSCCCHSRLGLRCQDRTGCSRPPHGGEDKQKEPCITLDQWRWRGYAFSLGIRTSTESRARLAAFQRGTEFLIAAKAAAVWKDHAWPI
jgi:hypothetical protein